MKKGALLGGNQGDDIDDLLEFIELNNYHDVLIFLKIVLGQTNISDEHDCCKNLLLKVASDWDWEIAEAILDNVPSVDINFKALSGYSVLHYAASYAQSAIIQKLLAYENIDIEAVNLEGETPFLLAAFNGNLEALKLLCEKNCNINHKNNEGMSALMLATMDAPAEIVEFLLEQDSIEVDPMPDGKTLLYMAVSENSLDTVKILLNNPRTLAQINLKHSEMNLSPLGLALKKEYWTIARLLLEVESLVVDDEECSGYSLVKLDHSPRLFGSGVGRNKNNDATQSADQRPRRQ